MIIEAACSAKPYMGACRCAVSENGVMLVSTTRRPLTPLTRHSVSTTRPIAAVPAAWNHGKASALIRWSNSSSVEVLNRAASPGGGVSPVSMKGAMEADDMASITIRMPARSTARSCSVLSALGSRIGLSRGSVDRSLILPREVEERPMMPQET